MANKDDRLKVAVSCSACGAIYPAWKSSDESIQPLGRTNDCRCGVSAFDVLSEDNAPIPSEIRE